MMHGIFPRGGIELVEHVQDKFHIEWVKELAEKSTQEQVHDPQTNPSVKSLGHLTSLSFYPPSSTYLYTSLSLYPPSSLICLACYPPSSAYLFISLSLNLFISLSPPLFLPLSLPLPSSPSVYVLLCFYIQCQSMMQKHHRPSTDNKNLTTSRSLSRHLQQRAFDTTGKLLDALSIRLLKHSDHMGNWPQVIKSHYSSSHFTSVEAWRG